VSDRDERVGKLVEIVKAGGPPFGGELNATIGEAVEAYQRAIGELRREIERLR
jgi:hypothetical protein